MSVVSDIGLDKSATSQTQVSLGLDVFLVEVGQLIHRHWDSRARAVIKGDVHVQISLVVWDRPTSEVSFFTLSHLLLSQPYKINLHLNDRYRCSLNGLECVDAAFELDL